MNSNKKKNNNKMWINVLLCLQDLLNDVLDSRGNEGIKCSSEIIHLFEQLHCTMTYMCDTSANIKLLLSLALDYLLLVG